MKLNNISRISGKIARIRFAIGMLVIGVIFGVIGALILWNCLNNGDNDVVLPVIILVVGVLALIGGIIFLVFAIKTKGDKLQQVDLSKFSQEKIDAVKNNIEPMNEYYFHFNGKMNQSYVLETKDRKPVVTINCDKIGILSSYKFTFKNELTGKVDTYQVSHTITERSGTGSFMVPCKSTFKMNGQDVFKLIGSLGYSIVSKIEGIRLNFDVNHFDVPVASLVSGGANDIKDGNKYGSFGNMPTRGVFSIKAKEKDLDAVALIAFAVSRVDFF